MPRPSKYSVASDNMATPYRGTRAEPREFDFLSAINRSHAKVNESWGACRNTTKKVRRGSKKIPKCKQYKAILGNGLCQDCWDKEIDARANYHRGKPNMPTNDDT